MNFCESICFSLLFLLGIYTWLCHKLTIFTRAKMLIYDNRESVMRAVEWSITQKLFDWRPRQTYMSPDADLLFCIEQRGQILQN